MDFKEAMESLRLKFSSGNNIPVERTTILDKEWYPIKEEVERLIKIEVVAKRLMIHIKVLMGTCVLLFLTLILMSL